jgi:hypothetical protein
MAAKKLTITVDEAVYNGLHKRVGRRNISRLLNDLAKPYALPEALEEQYREMAADELRETEAREWVDGTQGSTWDQIED